MTSTPAIDPVFAPPGQEWHPISLRYRTVMVVSTTLGWVITSTIPALFLGLVFQLWWVSAIIWGVAAAIMVTQLLLVNRRVRAWGYALREDDLYVTRGIMFRSLTAVPYGRMQVVEVTAGPLERACRVATLKFVTASPHTDATIPGLPPEEAARLRDRLTELGETRATGL